MRYITKKANKKLEQFFNQAAQTNGSAQPEGKTTIDKKSKTSRKSTKTVGEYVDFEEID